MSLPTMDELQNRIRAKLEHRFLVTSLSIAKIRA